ncbi:MAG: GAF domain-containing sensor histidine kinase [Candidatus Paceibacterota bacterium]
MKLSISKKIALLNQTTLESFADTYPEEIIKRFTETGLKILGADFSFTWWKDLKTLKYHLIYKSPNTPYEPKLPKRNGGKTKKDKPGKPLFVERIVKENYEKEFHIRPYMKSYVIIPVIYKENLYGNVIMCFKKEHIFLEEEKELAVSLGNATAKAVTIHRLKEKEQEVLLASAKQEVQLKEERLKNEFIANATHEIRTPLAIIRGNADLALLRCKEVPACTAKALKAINHEVEHLSEIISNLTLMISSDTSLKENTAFTEVDLLKIIKNTIKRCKTLADKKNISVKMVNTDDAVISGDEANLRKLFLNLIRNGINYGKVGGWIKVDIKREGNFVKIKVEDNGIGISKDDLPYIFNRFYRVDRSHSPDGNSVGLGLPIVKWIVEAHSGSIEVESILGKGTIFIVTLPTLKIH